MSAPASFVEAGEPVYVAVSAETDTDPVAEFFRRPRLKSRAGEWLVRHDNLGGLADLVAAGRIIRIDTTDALTAVASFAGVRVVPDAILDERTAPRPGQMTLKRDSVSTSGYLATAELAQLLFGPEQSEDIPSSVALLFRAAEATAARFATPQDFFTAQLGGDLSATVLDIELTEDLAARRVLSDMPTLLRNGLIHLEWLGAPPLAPRRSCSTD